MTKDQLSSCYLAPPRRATPWLVDVDGVVRPNRRQPRSPTKEGTRLLDALSERYADVHVSLLPSSILLGPNALQERQAAPDDGAGGVFVTSGSLRNGLRKSGVLLGDADERIVSSTHRVGGGDEMR